MIRAPAFEPGDKVPVVVPWVGDATVVVGVAGDPAVPSLLSMTASVTSQVVKLKVLIAPFVPIGKRMK